VVCFVQPFCVCFPCCFCSQWDGTCKVSNACSRLRAHLSCMIPLLRPQAFYCPAFRSPLLRTKDAPFIPPLLSPNWCVYTHTHTLTPHVPSSLFHRYPHPHTSTRVSHPLTATSGRDRPAMRRCWGLHDNIGQPPLCSFHEKAVALGLADYCVVVIELPRLDPRMPT
jgi:hypothetical protein